eukprot:282748-Rhodomonas_salina.1
MSGPQPAAAAASRSDSRRRRARQTASLPRVPRRTGQTSLPFHALTPEVWMQKCVVPRGVECGVLWESLSKHPKQGFMMRRTTSARPVDVSDFESRRSGAVIQTYRHCERLQSCIVGC